MKKILSIVSLAAVMAVSCKSNTDTSATKPAIPAPTDTAGLAQFQQWKAQNELVSTGQYNAAAVTPPATKTIVKYVPVKSTTTTTTSTSSNTAKASEKKGWSKGAKGAVIGGVGGAAAGAIINKKNRGAGAIIGGVLGAGAGYGIGHSKDKKDGRNR
jgi:hypothetical protein